MRRRSPRALLGATVALIGLTGSLLVCAPSADASPICLSWIDVPYLNDDTGASGYTSECAIESYGSEPASHAGDEGSDTGDGGETPADTPPSVHLKPPPPTLDPLCKTKVPSTIDANVAGLGRFARGFPTSHDASDPTLVIVTLDPNLQTGVYAGPDWYSAVETALGNWQYLLNQSGVAIKFVLLGTPESQARAESDMWADVSAGRLSYNWHIRGAGPFEWPTSRTVKMETGQKYGNGNGASLFMYTIVSPDVTEDWAHLSTDRIATLLAHEAGHTLGLYDIFETTPTSIMSGYAGESAPQPTCSDVHAVQRAQRQNPTTGADPAAGL